MQSLSPRWISPLAFVVGYVILDRISYIEPLLGLNITPWNPAPALGLVYWLARGRAAAPWWFAALVISEWLTRGVPEGWLLTVGLSLWLVAGYGVVAEAIRRTDPRGEIFQDRRSLFVWLCVVVAGTLVNSLGYLAWLYVFDIIPATRWGQALTSFWVGDLVGVSVSMPLFWILASATGRARVRALLRWETASYVLLALVMLWMVFEPFKLSRASHFYFLFLPMVWAAGRQGLAGAVIIAAILQLGVIIGARWGHSDVHSVVEFQLLDAALALVGFFLGVLVDEQRQAAEDLKRSLRLTAAGDMATALAHELNQPITAISAYGKTCELLLTREGQEGAREGDGALLRDTIRRMVNESTRAAEVVRRLRDFFRTGALRLETVDISVLIADAAQAVMERCEAQGVRLSIQVNAGTAVIDALQIGLVLRNLLANALDAVSVASVANPAIQLSAEVLAGGRLRVSVEDNGPGVSADIATRLFEPFVSSKSSGLGLGLAISKSIVETHGGTLWTEIGDRGVFRFELPLGERLDNP